MLSWCILFMHRGSAISCSSTGSNTSLRHTGPQPLLGLSAPEHKATGSLRLWYMRCLSVCLSVCLCFRLCLLVSVKAGTNESSARNGSHFGSHQISFRMLLCFYWKGILSRWVIVVHNNFSSQCSPRERHVLWGPFTTPVALLNDLCVAATHHEETCDGNK